MRVLVVPDVHGQTDKLDRIDPLIEEAEAVVFLGDFTDSFHEYDLDKLLHKVVEYSANPKITILWSNHDCHYAFKHRHFRCSGYAPDTQEAWDAAITADVTKDWRIWAEVEGFLLSHAGFHPQTERLCTDESHAHALQMARDGGFHEMWAPGYEVGGFVPYGGPTWLRWQTFHCVETVPQIVGHTPDRFIRKKLHINDTEPSYCMDTHLRHVAWIEGGKFTPVLVEDL